MNNNTKKKLLLIFCLKTLETRMYFVVFNFYVKIQILWENFVKLVETINVNKTNVKLKLVYINKYNDGFKLSFW